MTKVVVEPLKDVRALISSHSCDVECQTDNTNTTPATIHPYNIKFQQSHAVVRA